MDEHIPIWRYLDFAKYTSLLNAGGLYFARADTLGDPFEGSITVATQNFRETFMAEGLTNPEKFLRTMTDRTRMCVRNTAINSWHMSAHESAAMWRQYASDGKGIAIQSRYQKLVSCFPSYEPRRRETDALGRATHIPIHIGTIRYVDYDSEYMPQEFTFWPFLHKRNSFDHEHELRALVQEFPWNVKEAKLDLEDSIFPNGGVMIPVNLRTLVEAVYIAPEAPPWVKEVVEAVSKKYGYEFEVKQSILSREPLF